MKAALALLFLTVCIGTLSSFPSNGETQKSLLQQRRTIYDAHGLLISLDPTLRQATISHDAIPGYMGAMTMSFDVRDLEQLRGLEPGDLIDFHLFVEGDHAWIANLKKTGSSPIAQAGPDYSAGQELAVGDPLPDIIFVDQLGQTFHLREFQGRVLALTFIYTRCPLPTYCPLMNRNFQTAQTLLSQLMPKKTWHFLSISLDPNYDTREVLLAYADRYQAEAQSWSFATTSEVGIRKLGNAVGLEYKQTNEQISHNLRTVVIDASGHLRHIFRGNAWTPQELAAEMRSAQQRRKTTVDDRF